MTVWTILLAAGGSTRFGGPKALAPWRGGTLLSRALATARDVCDDHIVVITGGHADTLRPALPPAITVYNPDWQAGLGASIAAGARAVLTRDAAVSAMLILPVDQPFVDAPHLRALLAASADGSCALSCDGEITGPPAAVPARLFDRLITLTGDQGLKAALNGHEFERVPMAGVLQDIDTPADLARFSQSS